MTGPVKFPPLPSGRDLLRSLTGEFFQYYTTPNSAPLSPRWAAINLPMYVSSQISNVVKQTPLFAKYNVQEGDTPATVAKQFNTTIDKVIEANPGGYPFTTGQGIKVPQAPPPAAPAPVQPTGDYATFEKGIQGNKWKVVTYKDAGGNWVKATVADHGRPRRKPGKSREGNAVGSVTQQILDMNGASG